MRLPFSTLRAWLPPTILVGALAGCAVVLDFDQFGLPESPANGPGATSRDLTLIQPGVLLLERGKSKQLAIRIERRVATGPVTVRVLALPPGITATEATLGPEETTTTLELTAAATATDANVTVEAVAAGARDEKPLVLSIADPSDGGPDDTFLVKGTAGERLDDVAIDAAGTIFVAAARLENNTMARSIYRVAADGNALPFVTFPGGGPATDTSASDRIRIAFAPNGELVAVDIDLKAVYRYSTNLTVVPGYPRELDASWWSAFAPPALGRLVVLPDERILLSLTGLKRPNGLTAVSGMAQLTASGDADPTFGTSGLTFVSEYATSGDLVVTPQGYVMCVTTIDNHPAVARFSKSGVIDPSFGTDGVLKIDAAVASCGGLALASDGTSLLLAATDLTVATSRARVFRIASNGTIDASFGVAGTAQHEGAGFASAVGIVHGGTPDRILVAGALVPGEATSTAVVFGDQLNGAPDLSFGTGGVHTITLPVRPSEARVFRLQANGSMLIAGNLGETWFVTRLP